MYLTAKKTVSVKIKVNFGDAFMKVKIGLRTQTAQSGSEQTTEDVSISGINFDFATFKLGKGPIAEKKKRLEACINIIQNDDKIYRNCQDVIRKSKSLTLLITYLGKIKLRRQMARKGESFIDEGS
jgi:hypothetical protein